MILFFDTETTGLVEPRLVQLGLLYVTDELEVVSELCILVRPPKTIEEGAIKSHGKTNEYCEKNGVALSHAIGLFYTFEQFCHTLVGHNIKYDMQVLRNEGIKFTDKKKICTMELTTPILQFPHKNGNFMRRPGYKWPKLEEAYEFFMNKKIEGAHNALVDCKATLEIYKCLQELKLEAALM